jgi:hypothetical protein
VVRVPLQHITERNERQNSSFFIPSYLSCSHTRPAHLISFHTTCSYLSCQAHTLNHFSHHMLSFLSWPGPHAQTSREHKAGDVPQWTQGHHSPHRCVCKMPQLRVPGRLVINCCAVCLLPPCEFRFLKVVTFSLDTSDTIHWCRESSTCVGNPSSCLFLLLYIVAFIWMRLRIELHIAYDHAHAHMFCGLKFCRHCAFALTFTYIRVHTYTHTHIHTHICKHSRTQVTQASTT